MYFYKDPIYNLFHVGEDVLPAGNYILRIYESNTKVSLESADTHRLTMDAILITLLQKENGTYYIDLDDLLTDNKDFFKGGYAGDTTSLTQRVTVLEDTQIKILYYAEIIGTSVSGQIVLPTGATILFDQWENGVDAVVSNIPVDKPDYKDTGTDVVTLDINGNYTLSGTLQTDPAAFIYYILVPFKNFDTLDPDRIIDQSILFTVNSTSPENVRTVSPSGAQYTAIEDALDSIVGSSVTNRFTVIVYPGVYTPVRTLIIPPFTSLHGVGTYNSIRIQSGGDFDIVDLGAYASIKNFSLYGQTNIAYHPIVLNSPGDCLIENIVLTDCAHGIIINNSTVEVSILNLGLYAITIPMLYGVEIASGFAYINNVKIVDDSVVNIAIDASGTGAVVVNGAVSASVNLETFLDQRDSSTAICTGLVISNANFPIIVDNGSYTRLKASSIYKSRTTGLLIKSTAIGRVQLDGCTIEDSAIWDISHLSQTAVLYGFGSSSLKAINLAPRAKIYAAVLNLQEGDAGLDILGELHVGSPEFPTESVFGEGDSYTKGMLVYTWDGTSYVDVSELAADPNSAAFTFPNGNIDSAIYISTDRLNPDLDKSTFFGLKMIADEGGVSTFDLVVSGGTIADGGYSYDGEWSRRSMYKRSDDGFYLFFVKGRYCLNAEAPYAGINNYDTDFTSRTLLGTYDPINGNVGNPVVAEGDELINNPYLLEYWNGETSLWESFHYMITEANNAFNPLDEDIFGQSGVFQCRFEVQLQNQSWTLNDPMARGINNYWIRIRIANGVITQFPQIIQFKIHTNRSEINNDGYLEYFGIGRPFSTLPWDLGLAEPANASPANQDVFLSDNVAVGRQENLFQNGVTDRIGFNSYLPVDIDTSSGLYLRWSVISTDGTGQINWKIRWGWTSDGDNVYFDTADAPTAGPNEQLLDLLYDAPDVADVVKTYQVILDISKMRAWRPSAAGDMLWVSIERTVGDTHDGNVAMLNLKGFYLKWCEGGHI